LIAPTQFVFFAHTIPSRGGSASAQGGVEGHLFWECLDPSVLVDIKNWRFFLFEFFSVRPDGYQGVGEKKTEARVSSETLAFAEEILCLITWPPYTLKYIFDTLRLFEHI
jgi:hypothetical protein